MKKILLLGNFSFNLLGGFDGQTVKSRNTLTLLRERYGADNVDVFSYQGWKRHLLKTYLNLVKECKTHDVLVVMFGGARSLKLFLHFLPGIKRRNPKICIQYFVIGGFVYDVVSVSSRLKKRFCLINGAYIENKTIVNRFKDDGFTNVFYSPVFTMRSPLTSDKINQAVTKIGSAKIFDICTFSRVCEEKGISLAISAVRNINHNANETICKLHIYGFLAEGYKEQFLNLIKENSGIVVYEGTIDDNRVLETLCENYLCLFPTFFYGEGFPASILECFMAGLPVIASDWKYNSEIIEEGVNGYLCRTKDADDLRKKLLYCLNNPGKVLNMHRLTFEHSKVFSPYSSLKEMFEAIDCIMEK